VPTDGSAWDPQRTAAALAEAISGAEAKNGAPFELILFGNESADSGGFQVGVRVAHKLGRPIVNAIKGIDPADGSVTARREIDGGFEVYEVPTPAVLGVKEGINLPRYPTMKGRLASKKAELQTADVDAPTGGQGLVKLHRPTEQASNTQVLGNDEAAAAAVVDILEEIGLLQ
jgi:electron transfer flavoprotein beta subunit